MSEASKGPAEPAAEAETVRFRVLPQGAGRIFTGEFDAAKNRFKTHGKGALVLAPRGVAEALQARGLAEIVEPGSRA
jgi:hypothetical protein